MNPTNMKLHLTLEDERTTVERTVVVSKDYDVTLISPIVEEMIDTVEQLPKMEKELSNVHEKTL